MTKLIDITGQRFNDLTALEHLEGRFWLFRCKCGAEKSVAACKVKSGRTKSCGCSRRPSKALGSYGPFISREQSKQQGLTQYFEGTVCRHGHVEPCMTINGRCMECARLNGLAAHEKKKADPSYRAKAVQKMDDWREKNPERARLSARVATKKRRDEDPSYRVKGTLSARFRLLLSLKGEKKDARMEAICGADFGFIAEYLEAQFTTGMTWENQGMHGWHIDHIRPCASFDLTDPEQQKECFHYSNLQPLWAKDNLSKSDKWEPLEVPA